MFYTKILKNPVQYYDTSLIALILSIVTIPSFWYLSDGNLAWVVSCTILWALGVFIIFQPMMRYLFPYMLTGIGNIALTFILATVSIFLNTTLILFLLPNEDIEMIMNATIFSTSIGNIMLFIWFYIIVAGTLLSNMDFDLGSIYCKQRQILEQIPFFVEMLLIFIVPIGFLFWTDITYSFRVLLGVISIGVGLSLFIYKLMNYTMLHRLSIATVSLIAIFAINSTVVNIFGIERIPATDIKARMSNDTIMLDYQAKNIKNPSFQLSNSQQNGETTIYQIFASIPQIGLYLGSRVATIPDKEITIEVTKSQYTIHDQYNNRLLVTLDK